MNKGLKRQAQRAAWVKPLATVLYGLCNVGLFGACGSDANNATNATNHEPGTVAGGSSAKGGAKGTQSQAAGTGGASASLTAASTSAGGAAASTVSTQPTVGGASSNVGSSSTSAGGRSGTGLPSAGGVQTGGRASGGAAPVVGGSAINAAGRAAGGAAIGGGLASGGRTLAGTSGGSAETAGGNTMAGASPIAAAGSGSFEPSITKDGEDTLALSGLTIVSYGGYLNGESFQQEGIVSYKGYQYSAFWNTNRHVVMARRALPSGPWEKFEFTDYTNSADDAHNTVSLGICPGDETLHLSFDHHSNDLHYRKSSVGFLSSTSASWSAASFSAVTSVLVGNTTVTKVTYPRFVAEPGGSKLLFSARIGESGSGDEYLWEYDAASHAWASVGKYINGIDDSVNAYLHGLAYTKGGSPRRLHATWCWRDTSDASTNHDLLYVYSDDDGRTWKNNAGQNAGTTGTSAIKPNSAGISVVAIKQNRGLINQEHMAVDSAGGVHVLLSHMPDAQADTSNFDSARAKSEYFHYFRSSEGTWTRHSLGVPSIANFRGKLAISSRNNVYAILPDLRIVAAAAVTQYATWSLLDKADSGRFFSDPLIDSVRLETEDKLTIYYPQKSSPNIYSLDYTVK